MTIIVDSLWYLCTYDVLVLGIGISLFGGVQYVGMLTFRTHRAEKVAQQYKVGPLMLMKLNLVDFLTMLLYQGRACSAAEGTCCV